MQSLDAQTVIQNYIDAFIARDLDRCVALFDSDATLKFGLAKHSGTADLADWHRARADANLQIVQIDKMVADGDTILVDGVVASDRLKALHLRSIAGRAIFRVRDGKIVAVDFSPRANNPLGLLRR